MILCWFRGYNGPCIKMANSFYVDVKVNKLFAFCKECVKREVVKRHIITESFKPITQTQYLNYQVFK